MILRRIILLLCLSALFTPSPADTIADVDSLLRVYDSSRDGARLSLGRRLLDIYGGSSVFFDDVPSLSADMSREERDLMVWFGTERFYTTNSYYAEALEYNRRATELAEASRAKDRHTSQALRRLLPSISNTLLCDKAYCLFKRSDYTQSIEASKEAIRLCQQAGDKMQLSRAYLYLSLVNHALRKYDEATALVVKAIDINLQMGVNVQTHNVMGVACEIFCSAKEVDKAIDYGRQAVEAARAIDYTPGVANHLTQLSYAYDRKGDYEQGLLMADSAIAMVKASDPVDRNQMALALEFKGWNLIDLGRQREAAEALKEAIALQHKLGNSHAAWIDYRTLAEALEAYDPHASIDALKLYIRMGDSIHSEQLKELMSQANAEFHNDELKEENAASHRMNQIIVWTALAVVAMLVLAIASLWFAFRQKKRAAETIKQMADTREEFFTNVTHELRTPLTVILGVADELKSTGTTAETGLTIERQAQRLLTLVNQMLDISKVNTALGQQPRTHGDITVYVGMVVRRYQELARQKGITMEYDSGGQPINTTFVADYTEKMVGNLLANAVKYTPRGGRVDIGMSYHDGTLAVRVSDTGKGIAKADMPHIFEPFYRADDSECEGTGVGLALVKKIVDSMKGTISVESQPGHTTFRIELPITVQNVSETHTTTPGESPTLLIVEDNADVAALIGRQMEGRYKLCFAADGKEGTAKAKELMPDLIITDLMMPGTDGLQLCREIRADDATNHIPIIVVTAKATEKDRIEGRKAGADEYLYKPFNADELNVCVETLLKQRERLRRKFMATAATDTDHTQQTTAHNGADDEQTAPKTAGASTTQPEEGQEEIGPGSTNVSLTESSYPFADPSEEFIVNIKGVINELMASRESSVEMVAKKMCMTPYQLRNKLAAITGSTPKKYILYTRLEFARQMMAEDREKTVTEVAECCGFYDKSHFIHAFREAFGMTPNDYVKSLTEGASYKNR